MNVIQSIKNYQFERVRFLLLILEFFWGCHFISVKSRKNYSQEYSDQCQDKHNQDQLPSCHKTVSQLSNEFHEEDSGDDISNLRIWYDLEIHSSPRPPANIIEVKCIALESVCIAVPLSNPKKKIIHLDVQLPSVAFSGLKELKLHPLECTNYVVWYTPVTVGCRDERCGLSGVLYFIVGPLKVSFYNYYSFAYYHHSDYTCS